LFLPTYANRVIVRIRRHGTEARGAIYSLRDSINEPNVRTKVSRRIDKNRFKFVIAFRHPVVVQWEGGDEGHVPGRAIDGGFRRYFARTIHLADERRTAEKTLTE